jgi:hypothetical protein
LNSLKTSEYDGGHADVFVPEYDMLNGRETASLDGEILTEFDARTAIQLMEQAGYIDDDGQSIRLSIRTAGGSWAVAVVEGIQP